MNYNKSLVITAVVLSTTMLIILDSFTPLGIIDWILFVIPLLIAYRGGLSVKTYYPLVIVFSLSMLLGLFTSPGKVPIAFGIFNRSMGVSVFFLLTYFLKAQKLAELRINKFNLDLENEVRLRTSELESANTELDNFFMVNPELLCISDTNGNLIKMNKAWEQVLGYELSELEGKEFTYFIHPDDIQKTKTFYEQIINERKESTGTQNRYRCKDGTYRLLEWKSKPYGNLIYAAAQDITEKKQAEENFRGLFEFAPDAMIIVDKEGKIQKVNAQLERIFLYKRDDLICKQIEILIPKRFQSNHFKHRDEYIQSPKVRPMGIGLELFALRKDGSEFPVEISLAPIEYESGINILASIRDITVRKRLETEIKISQNRYRHIVETTTEGIWIFDDNDVITFINPQMENLLGYKEEELLGLKVTEFIVDEELADHKEKKILRKTGTIPAYERRFKRKDGSIIWVFGAGTAYIDEQYFKGYFSMFTDITEKKKLEQRLNNYLYDLERSNKELEQFAYVASHDLKEPLRMVSSYTQLLAERYKDKLDQDAKDFIGFAVDGAVRMQSLINDLLAYSRINIEGKKIEKINMEEILEEAKTNIATSILEKHALILNEKLPVVEGVKSQLVQLMQNLINNGIKFSNKNVQINISVKENHSEFTFCIKDNGIGIEKQYFDKIFMIFQRLHTREEFQGTGIGLAICKRIIDKHRGKIWVESEPGKGSSFYFTLPKQLFETGNFEI